MEYEEKGRGKRPYEKPVLHVLELQAKDVLGVACKTASGGDNWNFAGCGIANNCVQAGS